MHMNSSAIYTRTMTFACDLIYHLCRLNDKVTFINEEGTGKNERVEG